MMVLFLLMLPFLFFLLVSIILIPLLGVTPVLMVRVAGTIASACTHGWLRLYPLGCLFARLGGIRGQCLLGLLGLVLFVRDG